MRPDRGRLAIIAVFVLNGGVSGTLAGRLPALSDHLGLSPGSLGVALMMQAVGGLVAMPFAGRFLHRAGGRAATRWFMAAWGAALALPGMATSLPALIAAFVGLGAVAGFTDVAIVSQAVAAEKRLGGPLMSGLHGLWSIGAAAASGAGALAASAGTGYRANFFAAAAILAVLGSLAALALPPDPPRAAGPSGVKDPPRFALPTGTVLLLGLVAFSAAFAEGSCNNWTAIYLHTVAHASEGASAAGFTVFAGTMALTRLSGDHVRARFGAVRSVRAGGLVAVAGGVIVITSRAFPLSVAGFILFGAGIALVVPLSYAAAGHLGQYPAQAIAGVATVSYGSTLLGPGVVGGIASAVSLPASFLLITVLAVGIPVGARLMRSAEVFVPEIPAP
jgi:MFS family permease